MFVFNSWNIATCIFSLTHLAYMLIKVILFVTHSKKNTNNLKISPDYDLKVIKKTFQVREAFWKKKISFYSRMTPFYDVQGIYHPLRVRRALSILKEVPLRTRRVLSLYKVCGDSALLVLNGTSSNSDNTLLALNWRYIRFANAAVTPSRKRPSRKSHVRAT